MGGQRCVELLLERGDAVFEVSVLILELSDELLLGRHLLTDVWQVKLRVEWTVVRHDAKVWVREREVEEGGEDSGDGDGMQGTRKIDHFLITWEWNSEKNVRQKRSEWDEEMEDRAAEQKVQSQQTGEDKGDREKARARTGEAGGPEWRSVVGALGLVAVVGLSFHSILLGSSSWLVVNNIYLDNNTQHQRDEQDHANQCGTLMPSY
jgi:hypothetical protein